MRSNELAPLPPHAALPGGLGFIPISLLQLTTMKWDLVTSPISGQWLLNGKD